MSAANLLRHQARRALTSATRSAVSRQSACAGYSVTRCFSAAVEEQLIPGIGRGKTSTGLVSAVACSFDISYERGMCIDGHLWLLWPMS